ncbi:MAG: DNA glycosylase AlkZ-like family protein, partial [Candidatus Limnocylindrales bacterium]
IGGELIELGGGLLELSTRTDPPDLIPERLLGAFDPSIMGWPDRRWVVPEEHGSRVFAGGGLFRAVATVDGLAVATWGARRREGRIAVRLDPFEELSRDAEAALAAEARDVARFEGRQLEG